MYAGVTACLLLLACRQSPYTTAIDNLHADMSNTDVTAAIGQPCQTFTLDDPERSLYFVYVRPQTNTVLVISFSEQTIRDWSILVPENASTEHSPVFGYGCRGAPRCSV